MSSRSRRLSGLLAAALVASVVSAPVASSYPVTDGPLFNNPKGNEAAKFRLVRHVEKTIAGTPKGHTIRIATFLMDRQITAARLVAAHRRGVNVRVVMDDGIRSRPSRRLARVLGRNTKKRSWAVFCHNSCRGTRGQMHTKYYTFSRSRGQDDVVMVSSANLNNGGARLGWNDLFTITERPKVFNKFRAIHKAMARDKPVRPPGRRFQISKVGPFTSTFLPKPGVTRRTDPIYHAMNKVHCRGVRGGAGRQGRTAVNVSMFWWSGDRGMYLARKLLALRRQGCRISVTYGAPSDKVAAVLRRAAWQGRIGLYDSRQHRNNDGVVDLRVHTKYMLISGNWGKENSSWKVFTGSANWALGSLTGGDEVMLTVNRKPAYKRYMRHYDYVKARGARKIGR